MSSSGCFTITVWLKEPVWGRDPGTRDKFKSNRHIVLANRIVQDSAVTSMIDENGEIVAEWPTPNIERLAWHEPDPPHDASSTDQSQEKLQPDFDVKAGVGSVEWREQIQRKHDRAYSPWTPDEDEQLREEAKRGKRINEMSRTHGRTHGAIIARLEQHRQIEGQRED